MEWYAQLKGLVGVLVMPLPVFVVLVLLGAVLLLRRRHAAGIGTLVGAIAFLLLASSPLSVCLLAPLENRHPPFSGMTEEEDISAVVVLAAGWRPDSDWPISSQLNVSSAIRLFEGVRLAIALPEAKLILSGGSRDLETRPPVAHGLAQAARELGIASERLVLVDTPLDTRQEARAVAEVLDPDSRFLLVTTAAHMPRAVAHFQCAGLSPIPAPTQRRTARSDLRNWLNWRPSATYLTMTETAWHEYLGLLALRWEHWELGCDGASGS